ncbi:dihydroxy-acid dehydratase [Stratiformator vulcanicus]|uniref:Dihydroxy-acid dehydratase n=1 Tax=Stratiformator vulcanicus TaxID=2527980 RepID=A0A517R560_9PLAN|nr:dihydroxy-acid dehydratase [Stratiformator vulcanicus]QDT39025.1 Dihydroxy-acid dehydratase [Stratiformator vulcanicus]
MPAEPPLNWNSRQLTRGWQKGVTAFYYGLGLDDSDFDRPQVGIGVPLLDGNLCNVHAYELGKLIAEGCGEAGLIGFPFGTPGVSDNITQGHAGGRASLVSRNVIADSAEMVTTAHCYDALIGLHHCDKNGPGFAMALARTNYPGLLVSGGSIKPGCHNGRDTSILDVYDSQAAVAAGTMEEAEADEILKTSCPGPGGCGIAASFNTWGLAMEAIGLMPPYSSSHLAVDQDKRDECRHVGGYIRTLLERNIRPRDILTKPAFANAMRTIAAAGGSSNGVLHLLALAREAEVDFTLRDVQAICRETPVLCSFAPRGVRTMADLQKLGGTPLLLKHFLKAGLLDGDCLTVTGQTLAENLADIVDVPVDQDLIAPIDQPFKERADIAICFGNLAPDGIVFKVSSMEDPHFRGRALCFSEPRDIVEAAKAKRITPGTIVILRYLGPKAAAMPEVLVATSALSTKELDGKVALISDARVSGVSHGAIGVHCAPEALVGGPIALIEDGDAITFDVVKGTVELEVNAEDLAARQQRWSPPEFGSDAPTYLKQFAATVGQADVGCVAMFLKHF